MGRMVQHALHIHQLRHLFHLAAHLLGGNAVIFQREGNILGNGEADELPIGVLQHRTDNFGQAK